MPDTEGRRHMLSEDIRVLRAGIDDLRGTVRDVTPPRRRSLVDRCAVIMGDLLDLIDDEMAP